MVCAAAALWIAVRPQVGVVLIPQMRVVEAAVVVDDCGEVQTPMTGTPLPPDAGTTPAAGTVRFMASNPHVPLAESVDGGLSAAPAGACKDWPRLRERWLALDRFGAIAGTHESLAAEAYDLTGCYEMTTRRVDGSDGVGVLASAGYVPRPSPEWKPTPEQRASFDALVAKVDAVFVAPAGSHEPLFFHSTTGSPTAVIGGRVLLVAALVEDAWAVRHIELLYGLEQFIDTPYQPLVVADLDGDGSAEIVFRESEGPSWNDTILSVDGLGWRRAAESIGGGTI